MGTAGELADRHTGSVSSIQTNHAPKTFQGWSIIYPFPLGSHQAELPINIPVSCRLLMLPPVLFVGLMMAIGIRISTYTLTHSLTPLHSLTHSHLNLLTLNLTLNLTHPLTLVHIHHLLTHSLTQSINQSLNHSSHSLAHSHLNLLALNLKYLNLTHPSTLVHINHLLTGAITRYSFNLTPMQACLFARSLYATRPIKTEHIYESTRYWHI